jgi:HAD superfamily phosphoserine phosphatase-like hydrolase
VAGHDGHPGGTAAHEPGARDAGTGGRRILALLDYDGTLTTHECNEIALQRFVGDAWRALEAEAQADRMSHAECFDLQVRMIEAPRDELLRLLTAVAEPAPGLAAFFAALEERGGRAAVVSAGLREAIEGFWRRESLPQLELFASELVGGGPGGGPPYRLAFSEALGDCPRCGPRSCKSAVLRALRRPGDLVIVFGDGASDLCPAREADLTFARGHLAERCAAEGLAWRPLGDFAAVMDEIDQWLEGRAPVAGTATRGGAS